MTYKTNYERPIYKQSIVRNVLPVIYKDISKEDNNVVQIGDGWVSKNGFLEWDSIDNDTKLHTIGRIHNSEDNAFINGNKYFNITGISETKTIRHDLLNAIKEFNAKYIITSSKYLNPTGVTVFRWPELDQHVHYLVPDGITKDDAEFVISADIIEEFFDYHYKQFWHDIHEWVKIAVYNPDFFVKVCRKEQGE